MHDTTNATEISTRRRARQIRQRFDDLCQQFERRTSTAYRLRGRTARQVHDHMRRFWVARDSLRLQLHEARSCTPERTCHLRDQLNANWRHLQELVSAPQTQLANQ